MKQEKIPGLLGGMGPETTVDFMSRFVSPEKHIVSAATVVSLFEHFNDYEGLKNSTSERMAMNLLGSIDSVLNPQDEQSREV